MGPKVRVVLYTKPNCGLCEEMKAQMAEAGVDELYELEEFDIEFLERDSRFEELIKKNFLRRISQEEFFKRNFLRRII